MTNDHPLPQISVIVVTWRRAVELRRCLDALAQSRREAGLPSFEVLTVHGDGDDTVPFVQSEHPEVRVLRAPVRNISVQRNLGARAARGDVLVFLDDDAWPRPGWLQAIARTFADPAVLAASGAVLRADGSRQYGPMAVSPMARPIPLADGAPLPAGCSPTLPGCNYAVRRRALFAVGGFDETIAYHFDDVELSMRLFRHSGCRTDAMPYVADVSVHHEAAPGPHRRTLFDRDWFRVARESVYVAFRHGRRWPLRLLVVPGLLQVPKAARFFLWLLQGKMRPTVFARCLCKHGAGVLAGYWKGLVRSPLLPLRLEQDPQGARAPETGPARPIHSSHDEAPRASRMPCDARVP